MRKPSLLCVLSAMLLGLSGCGTIMDLAEHTHGGEPVSGSMIYGGVQTDAHYGTAVFRQLGGSEDFRVVSILGFFFFLADTPLSFALDTLLLPATITEETSKPSAGATGH